MTLSIVERDKPRSRRRDLERGKDTRGDQALFIDYWHVRTDGWSLDVDIGPNLTFFRVIKAGVEQPSHGWARGMSIVQWG